MSDQNNASAGLVPDWVKRLPDGTARLIKSVGPLLLSQFDAASDRYVSHRLKLASVEVFKEAMIQEASVLADARRQLLANLPSADAAGRVRIVQDLEFIEGQTRQWEVYVKAFDYLSKAKETKETSSGNSEEVELAWLDRFHEYARKQNEPWRVDLLARALAKEAEKPGSIGPRALWIIGTIEEKVFHAFATILDLSSTIGTSLMLPTRLTNQEIPSSPLGNNVRLGHLAFILSDTGLIGNPLSASRTIPAGNIFAYYRSEIYLLSFKSAYKVKGIIPTDVGNKIASLYEPKTNTLGLELFTKWLDSIANLLSEKPSLIAKVD